jgi:aminopeptidase N
MLRHDIGDKDFMEGLRLYYDRYFDSNALSSDFQHVMEEASGKDLSRFFQQWLYTAGHPELRIWHKTIKKTGTTEVFIEQEQDHLFEFSLELQIKDTSGKKNIEVAVKERVTKITIPSLNDVKIVPDPDVNLLFRQID